MDTKGVDTNEHSKWFGGQEWEKQVKENSHNYMLRKEYYKLLKSGKGNQPYVSLMSLIKNTKANNIEKRNI